MPLLRDRGRGLAPKNSIRYPQSLAREWRMLGPFWVLRASELLQGYQVDLGTA